LVLLKVRSSDGIQAKFKYKYRKLLSKYSVRMGFIKEKLELRGKNVVIAGGSGGIGSKIACGFVEMGANVAIIGRTEEKLKKVVKDIKEMFSVDVLYFVGDLTDSKQVNSIVNQIIQRMGHIDVLVNCQGIGQWVPAEELREEDWDRMMEVNVKSVFLMCQAVGKHMIQRRKGKIINIASTSSMFVDVPQPQAHYNASKAAVVMLSRSLAYEWAKYNITVNCVSPTYTLTPMVEQFLKDHKYSHYLKVWESLTPMGRIAKPEDIVGIVLFLATDAADYITGQNILVDGGYTLI
jgi:NAD(P)-dependent dehydrogenase (short-subunit alcohol dehydrogenase family)